MKAIADLDIKYELTLEIGPEEIATIVPIIQATLGEWDETWFMSVFSNHSRFMLLTALDGDNVVGYKLGYEVDKWEFYSWLGGVLPKYQKQGIANSLMITQHEWCKSQGYNKVRTKTLNKFREMLLLNIKSGFDIIGTYQTETDGTKIILEKRL